MACRNFWQNYFLDTRIVKVVWNVWYFEFTLTEYAKWNRYIYSFQHKLIFDKICVYKFTTWEWKPNNYNKRHVYMIKSLIFIIIILFFNPSTASIIVDGEPESNKKKTFILHPQSAFIWILDNLAAPISFPCSWPKAGYHVKWFPKVLARKWIQETRLEFELCSLTPQSKLLSITPP